MNKNVQLYSNAIEGHRKRARCQRLLYAQRGRIDSRIGLVEQKSNIFDESIPNDLTQVLQPIPWRSSNVTTKDKQNIKKFTTKSMQKISDFGECMLIYIPPKPKA